MQNKKFAGVDLQISPTDYHTWGCPVLVLESPLNGGLAGIPKWEPRASNGFYLVHFLFRSGSVDLLLNTRTGHIFPSSTVWSLTKYYPLWITRGGAQSQEIGKTKQSSTQSLLHRKNSLLQNIGILTNIKACSYPGRPVNNTCWSQLPNIRIQGLIPRLNPEA